MNHLEIDKEIISAFRDAGIWQQMNFSERGCWAGINGAFLKHGYISKKNLGKLQGILENVQYRLNSVIAAQGWRAEGNTAGESDLMCVSSQIRSL